MRRRGRFRRVGKWVGLALCVLIWVTWAASAGWGARLSVRGAIVAFTDSGIVVVWNTGRIAAGGPQSGPGKTVSLFLVEFISDPPGTILRVLSLPFWLPLALLILPTAWLFWVDRRRKPRPGFCSCGYDLRGNVSGKCPECGEKTTTSTERKHEVGPS